MNTNESPHLHPTSVTRILAERALGLSVALAPANVRLLIKQCLLDWIGVTIVGAHEPVTHILREELSHQGGPQQATIIGDSGRLPTYHAVLLNGTASHALDYDDVNHAIPGHPSAPIIPAILALAEDIGASGTEFMDAFLAGYETSCRIGQLVAPSHYEKGFHATATIGGFGAAAACAKLLRLNAQQTTYALGIAATRGAGLKSMFGTSCKPLHAGQTALTGLMAASLARRGLDSREDALECAQGFAATYSSDFNPKNALSEPAGGFHILSNLFKYHASCFETQAAIECGIQLRRQYGIESKKIKNVLLHANTSCNKICNIEKPKTALETKFSLRLASAFALAGIETASPAVYNETNAAAPELVNLRDKVKVMFTQDLHLSESHMSVELIDGQHLEAQHDSGIPETDIAAQGSRLEAKFHALVAPFLSEERVTRILQVISELDALRSMSDLTKWCATDK